MKLTAESIGTLLAGSAFKLLVVGLMVGGPQVVKANERSALQSAIFKCIGEEDNTARTLELCVFGAKASSVYFENGSTTKHYLEIKDAVCRQIPSNERVHCDLGVAFANLEVQQNRLRDAYVRALDAVPDYQTYESAEDQAMSRLEIMNEINRRNHRAQEKEERKKRIEREVRRALRRHQNK